MGAFNWIKHSSSPPLSFMNGPTSLLILSGINIWDDCKQQGTILLPSCTNQCCYISKSGVSVYANQDSGEVVVSFGWTVLSFNTDFMRRALRPTQPNSFMTLFHKKGHVKLQRSLPGRPTRTNLCQDCENCSFFWYYDDAFYRSCVKHGFT